MSQRHGVARRSVVGIGIALASITGCANAHEADVDGGEPLLRDIGPRDIGTFFEDHPYYLHDAHVVPVVCGSTTCPIGTECCNPSCGICVMPGTGCIDLLCSDGGTSRRCGGLTGGTCDPTEYCSYPDFAMCGATDAEGVCRPRPGICPPGGATVCGCDGNDYLGDCAANASGTDVLHAGSCHTTMSDRSVSATQGCAPFDGPAWDFYVTTGAPAVCDASGPSLRISLWGSLSPIAPGQTFRIDGSQGQATSCPAGVGGPPCTDFGGIVTVHSFIAGDHAVISYDLSSASGGHVTGDHLSVSLWCAPTPACGG